MTRIDRASRRIAAPTPTVYRAFKNSKALETWLPPKDMRGKISVFDFREGGGYRMRLTYENSGHRQGKTTENADDVAVQFTALVENESIEQSVTFNSDDEEFSGTMKMTWTFKPINSGTEVSVQCENVPRGIAQTDHHAGLTASLENLAEFVE